MTVMRETVVKALAELNIRGNEEGLIPGFNVLVNQLPAAFWNNFAERIIEAAEEADLVEEAEAGLVRCAYECGYHTGYGIVTSEEFNSVVAPMVTEGALDVLRGAYAVFTAWGWAKSGIVKHVPNERLVVRAVDYYESDGPKSERCKAFMIRGVSAAFFELAYATPYPNGMDTFICHQTQGIETGDRFGEFAVTKKAS